MSLKQALQWRYATKKMNGQAVPQEKVDQIVEAALLAPSSSGLQPYKLIVVSNAELKEKLKAVASNQSQITDASHVLIFAAWDNYTEERINNVFSRMNRERGVPDSATDAYRTFLLSAYVPRTAQENFEHAARQAYISFGIALAEAAVLEVDATPMEGFDAAALDELLSLREKGLRSVVIMPLGYRDTENDWLYPLKKVRTPMEEFLIEEK
ncbi:NAD(P)H-dependent oxidoreductase [Pedobacter yulinensis]|uniref:NAD(P)H-dependent oxidoreductase n=1 Tax=Pedobacter yulinensis TaxID=2126353 RepID=A0A2T3HP33_9SPHI|nr:NAD(P)H-dependent oxidoreductase [Pedobacter yulinensis]PST84167.1 NAD(P)H-dependent oxidoreductase [Pedobacter yulinensis]